jgi:hypothetical protein
MKEKLCIWLAWHLPRELVYWCAGRLMAEATTGVLSNEESPGVLAVDCLRAWRA